MNTTHAELIELIGKIENPGDAYTIAELAEMSGNSIIKTQRKIKMLVESGAMAFAGKKPILCIDNVTRPIPSYRVAR